MININININIKIRGMRNSLVGMKYGVRVNWVIVATLLKSLNSLTSNYNENHSFNIYYDQLILVFSNYIIYSVKSHH